MPSPERFVTLFDSNFLPQGLALCQSLREHCPKSEPWVLCMDEDVERSLSRLEPDGIRTMALRDLEDARLLAVKADRNPREYCWTMTSFAFDAVFERCPEAARVTYLDADLFFFDLPSPLFEELEDAGASVLVTEHGYDPAYDKSKIVGRFCVQFLTMDRSERAAEVRRWWQERVVEWCYDRREPGRFGDQKYLDHWPELFGDRICVLSRKELALAPWNVRMESARSDGDLRPVFYHFHSFRIVTPWRARKRRGRLRHPRVRAGKLYQEYAAAVGCAESRMEAAGVSVPCFTLPKPPGWDPPRQLARKLLGRADVFIQTRGRT